MHCSIVHIGTPYFLKDNKQLVLSRERGERGGVESRAHGKEGGGEGRRVRSKARAEAREQCLSLSLSSPYLYAPSV